MQTRSWNSVSIQSLIIVMHCLFVEGTMISVETFWWQGAQQTVDIVLFSRFILRTVRSTATITLREGHCAASSRLRSLYKH